MTVTNEILWGKLAQENASFYTKFLSINKRATRCFSDVHRQSRSISYSNALAYCCFSG
jgi:hypothetical protein